MTNIYKLNIEQAEKYLQTIFELQDTIRVKDSKIQMLEFELALEKQLLASFKKFKVTYAR